MCKYVCMYLHVCKTFNLYAYSMYLIIPADDGNGILYYRTATVYNLFNVLFMMHNMNLYFLKVYAI